MQITLKKMAQCSKEEIHLISYFDVPTDTIVIIEDHPKVKASFPFVLAHEVAHYYIERTSWKDSTWEELYNILFFERSILKVNIITYIGMLLKLCFT